eukprot:6035545-Alexandrium_andersonii.AAC.1
MSSALRSESCRASVPEGPDTSKRSTRARMLAISSFRGSTARAIETLVSCRMLLRRSFKSLFVAICARSLFVAIEDEIACS